MIGTATTWLPRPVSAGASCRMHGEHLLERELTRSVIGAFYDAYNKLGFGFLESVCAAGLERELKQRGHSVSREHAVPVIYDGVEIAFQRIDMLVDGRLVVEIKSTELLPAAAKRQLFNYLRGTGMSVGLLLHFGPEPRFYRLVHTARTVNQPDSPHPRSSDHG